MIRYHPWNTEPHSPLYKEAAKEARRKDKENPRAMPLMIRLFLDCCSSAALACASLLISARTLRSAFVCAFRFVFVFAFILDSSVLVKL